MTFLDLILVFVGLAGVIGVLAALLPARRASRMDILRAISTVGIMYSQSLAASSASIWVGWYSSVRPLNTGTIEYSASSCTMCWLLPRYSIASYMRLSTRAVSFMLSLWPICEDVGSI